MKNNPDVKIRIVGYADKFGPINVNLRISQERAEAVANMLKKDYGINSNRMVIEYVGKEKEIIEIFIDKLLYHPYVCLLSGITSGRPFYCGWPLFRRVF